MAGVGFSGDPFIQVFASFRNGTQESFGVCLSWLVLGDGDFFELVLVVPVFGLREACRAFPLGFAGIGLESCLFSFAVIDRVSTISLGEKIDDNEIPSRKRLTSVLED